MKKLARAKKTGSKTPARVKENQRSSKAKRNGLTCRERFLNACHCKPVDCAPIWLMRQAGRALPEYRALKEQYSFLQLVQTPELATEVTLQPIRRFGFDAAILFSDILVIPEALGQKYHFKDAGGIEMEFVLKNAADVEKLQVAAVRDELDYVAKALPMIKRALNGDRALIGFAGSPWTLANFMVDGAGVKEYVKTKGLMYSDPKLFERLMEKLTRGVTDFLQLQIDAGADAVQIFDSLGGVLSDGNYEYGSARWIRQIVDSLRNQVPVIVFGKGVHGNWTELAKTKAQVLGVDWNAALAEVRDRLPAKVGVQGNLDPFLLCTTPEVVAKEARRILASMRGRTGHIFNLGHGVPPGAKIECIEALVSAVRSFK
jgi:uroporphyrinogen decarboxylase